MNSTKQLREEVCEANRSLARHALAPLTWGNVSGLSADGVLMAIKPSGVAYDTLTSADIVVVDMNGRIVEGALRPSTDTPTHLVLYRAFGALGIRGITHTHSRFATAFCQARRELSCLGTTHADHFCGAVPVTRALREDEMTDYETATGASIVELFAKADPIAVPGALVAGHAPFVWGKDARASVEHAIALEAIAEMALSTYALTPDAQQLEPHVLSKHHERKHGARAYYGQR